MSEVIARITGTALVPGVSRNRRWYKPEHLQGAADAANRRIARGENMVMKTHHDARDDSTRITARITGMHVTDEGTLDYAAEISANKAGKDIATLLDTTDGRPAVLKTGSIRGYWTGKVKRVTGPDGQDAETAEGLELEGVDFTGSPGVPGAQIKTFAWMNDGKPAETTERVLITETLSEARVTFTEDAADPVPPGGVHELDNGTCVSCEAAQPMGKRGSGISGAGGPYADPGYQKDGKQRYQLDSAVHAKAAWSYVNQAKNAAQYTSAQLKRVKRRIMAALRKFGVKVSAEADLAGWCFGEAVPVAELMPVEAGCEDQCGSFSINASNGPLNITLSCWQMDPADLDIIVAAAARAAGAALRMLDPDLDGDIDVPGTGPGNDPDQDAPDETTDDGADLDGSATTMTPATAPAAGNTEERTVMTVTSTETAAPAGTTPAPAPPAPPAAPAAPAGFTQEQLDAAVAAAAARAVEAYDAQRRARKAAREAAAQPPAPAAPPAQPPATPAAPAATETDEQIMARLLDQRLAAEGLATAGTAPAATPAQETAGQRMARLTALVDQRLAEAKQQLVATGKVGVVRAGLTADAPVSEDAAASGGGVNAWGMPSHFPAKPPHEYTDEERDKFLAPVLTSYYLGDKADKIA